MFQCVYPILSWLPQAAFVPLAAPDYPHRPGDYVQPAVWQAAPGSQQEMEDDDPIVPLGRD